MARKKDPPKPLFALKQDFYDSLDNVSQQGIMLIQAIEMTVRSGALPKPMADVLTERVAAFRAALVSED